MGSSGSNDEYGSWNTICACRRIRPNDPFAIGSPSKKTSPDVGSSRRRARRPSVDLPDPDSPTRPSVSPGWIVTDAADTACTWPRTRRSTPSRTGNNFVTERSSRSVSAGASTWVLTARSA